MRLTNLVLLSVAYAVSIENEWLKLAPPTPLSFLDELYGELVATPESRAHTEDLLKSGAIRPIQEEVDPLALKLGYNVHHPEFHNARNLVNLARQTHQLHQKSARQNSHDGYLRARGKIQYPDDDDTRDLSPRSFFGGILTFGGFDTFNCFDPDLLENQIDIAIVGAPFDTGTSYRPGARFGPEAIRLNARRLGEGVTPVRGKRHSKLLKLDPYNRKTHNLTIVDCGDVPMTPFDNRIALNQLYRGQRAIHKHESKLKSPKVVTMGGDHTITLMALRSAYEKYGRLAVLHFDSHIDTWDPQVLGGGITDYMSLNHGTFLHFAAEKGYLAPDHCLHLGLRAPYIEPVYDRQHDRDCGFDYVTARDIDDLGISGVIERIKETVGDLPVYISVDIDVLDPANAPGTGTVEIGGWTGRELLSILDGIEGINVVGADVVEVSPPFDTNGEITSLAATAVIDLFLGLMLVTEV